MKPFPADAEIVAAIQLLARANVLREYEVTQSLDGDLIRHANHSDLIKFRTEEDAKLMVAKKIAEVAIGSAGWQPVWSYGAGEQIRMSGWVVAYADCQRALVQP